MPQVLSDFEIMRRLKPLYSILANLPEDRQIELLYGFVGMAIDSFPEESSSFIDALNVIAQLYYYLALDFITIPLRPVSGVQDNSAFLILISR